MLEIKSSIWNALRLSSEGLTTAEIMAKTYTSRSGVAHFLRKWKKLNLLKIEQGGPRKAIGPRSKIYKLIDRSVEYPPSIKNS
jgi:DNA-binding transcriptional regulator GbsR (MarR family)